MRRGAVDMAMDAAATNLDGNGATHEGAVLTLIDAAGATCPWTVVPPSPGASGATIALSAQVLGPLPRAGLVARAVVRARDARICWTDVAVVDGASRIAHAFGTVVYRPQREELVRADDRSAERAPKRLERRLGRAGPPRPRARAACGSARRATRQGARTGPSISAAHPVRAEPHRPARRARDRGACAGAPRRRPALPGVRARGPGTRGGPMPRRCSLGVRPTSNLCWLAEGRLSRLAETYHSTTLSPAAIRCPLVSVSALAERRK